MILLGCRPKGRNIEQHDIFFGIAKELRDLIPEIKTFWKNASPIHVDAWREVTNVHGFHISVQESAPQPVDRFNQLFFLNLGGYKPGQFEEFHYKMLAVAADKDEASAVARQTAFYLHTGFGEAAKAHIDDRFGVDIDDIFEVKDILPLVMKEKFSIALEKITGNDDLAADEIHLGFFRLQEL